MKELRSFRLAQRELKILDKFYFSTLKHFEQNEIIYKLLASRAQDLNALLQEEGLFWVRNEYKKRIRSDSEKKVLREVVMIRAISALEVFLVDLIKDVFLVTKKPFKVDDNTFEFSQRHLLANGSQTDIYQIVIERETRKVSGGSFRDTIKYFKRRFGIDLTITGPGSTLMSEYHDARNILVHRLGKTDDLYRRKYETESKVLLVSEEYIRKLLTDLNYFVIDLHNKVMEYLSNIDAEDAVPQNSYFVVDVLSVHDADCSIIKPKFQFWADDEFVVLSDLLVGTESLDSGGIRYQFCGSKKAIQRLYSLFKQASKRGEVNFEVYQIPRFKEKKPVPTENLVQKICMLLPVQPWPKAIHKKVAQEAGCSNSLASAAIDILIERNVFYPQVNGEILKD